MRMRLTILCLLLVCWTTLAFPQGPTPEQGAQQGPPPGGGMQGGGMRGGSMHGGGEMQMRHMEGHDPLGDFMFPPEMILEHTQELNLTPEQKTAIRNEVKSTQAQFTDLQFQLQDNMQAFTALLHQPKTDERQALAALDKALDVERQIKKLHVGMVIRIKNLLTAEQIEKLHQMHKQMGPMHQRHPGGGGGPGDDDNDEDED